MRKAFRWLGLALLAVTAAGLVTAAVFWFTVPQAPGLPSEFDSTIPADSSVTDPGLRAELLRMYWLDQAVRDSAGVAAFEDLQSVGAVWNLLQEGVRERRVDGPNVERVKRIVAEHGWPTYEEVGADGLDALFMVVQHANFDRDLQRDALDPLRAAYEAGHVSGSQLAMNTDRVRLADGEGQLYGTQVGANMGEAVSLSPIEDEANVDVRRAELGLPPLAEYLDRMCAELEICVDR